MKPIRLTKGFDKSYAKRIGRNQKLRKNYIDRVPLFKAGERGYPLFDHALTRKMKGKRAFSVAGDIRVVYEETENEIIFLDIGSHKQVYR